MGDGTLGTWLHQASGVPWLKDDPNLALKNISTAARLRAVAGCELVRTSALHLFASASAQSEPFDAKAEAGQKIFMRAGCAARHTPPLDTSNKLTLARGFKPPSGKPATLDVLPISVGTDPGLALSTRKGTGD